jgi:hypothetical protein
MLDIPLDMRYPFVIEHFFFAFHNDVNDGS